MARPGLEPATPRFRQLGGSVVRASWANGTSFGTLRPPWPVAAHSRRAAAARKLTDLQERAGMARPGLEPGTPRFSAVVSSRRPGRATSQPPLPFAQRSTLPGSRWHAVDARGHECRATRGSGTGAVATARCRRAWNSRALAPLLPCHESSSEGPQAARWPHPKSGGEGARRACRLAAGVRLG
jgi:hypothetical protein